MINLKIDLHGLKDAAGKFSKGSEIIREEMAKGVTRALTFGQSFMSKYPNRHSGFSMQFKSDRQRRFFFAALRDGTISVPYRRTGTLGKSWDTEIHSTGANVSGVIRNTRDTYNELVHLQARQAAVHRGVWQVIEDLERSPQIDRIKEFFIEIGERIKARMG